MRRREALVSIGSSAVAALAGCGGGTATSPTDLAAPTPTPTPEPVHTLVGAGDIGWGGLPGARLTGELLDGIGGTVFTAGDNAYMSGTRAEFAAHYEPFWGRHKARTRPCPGNHEFETDRGRPYFEYFGANAGPDTNGWYDFMLGSWLVLSLNSAARCDPGSAQYEWVKAKLASTPVRGTVAYWHHPLFSSGENGPNDGAHGRVPDMRHLWRLLYQYRVDVVINGHDHWYERFGPQDFQGHADPLGPRQFTVGTGGAKLYRQRTVAPNSEKRVADTWGVLKLELLDGEYRWQFIATDRTVLDEGSEKCR